MFRFRLGRIPVGVHFSHLLFSGLIALSWKPTQIRPEWPDIILGDPAHPEYLLTLVLFVAAWMAIIFVSVLVHELGHAGASLAFGYRPTIQLEWMGGHTQPNPNETIPWHRDVLLTLAGPAAGMLLGLTALGAFWIARQHTEPLSYFLLRLFAANAFWAVLNLLPVAPLDGGRLATTLSMKLFGRTGFFIAQVLSLLCVAGTIAYLVRAGGLEQNLFLVMILVLFGWRSVGLIGAYFRGEAPYQGPTHPGELGLQRALHAYSTGETETARKWAQSALETEPSLPTRSALHHLLGWMAVKAGEGRTALDHFAQVQGKTVEPHALAAAFSLVGDDERAVPLWEQAYTQSNDRTVLHEWAGALIRLDRRDALSRLPAPVDELLALSCAERVFFIRQSFDQAAMLASEALEKAPAPERAYDAACAFARAGNATRAVEMLRRAESLGFKDVDYALSDSDLATLHQDRAFLEWVYALRKNARR